MIEVVTSSGSADVVRAWKPHSLARMESGGEARESSRMEAGFLSEVQPAN